MIIDILKEKFDTNDSNLAIVRSWSHTCRSAPSLAAGLIEVGLCANKSRAAAIHTVSTTMLVNGRKLSTSSKFIGEPINFNKFEIELKFGFVLLNEHPNRFCNDDRLERSVNRQQFNIGPAIQSVLGPSVVVMTRTQIRSLVVTIVFSNAEEECNKRFPNMADYSAKQNTLYNRPNVVREKKGDIRATLTDEQDNDYFARKLAMSEISDQRKTIEQEIERLEDIKKHLDHISSQLKIENSTLVDQLTEEHLIDAGYRAEWKALVREVGEIADEDIMRFKVANDLSNIIDDLDISEIFFRGIDNE